MGKTNYNKVEDSFEEGMQKLKRSWLLEKADEASGKKKKSEGELTPKQMMTIVEYELKWLHKINKDVYKTLNIKKKDIEKLMALVKDPEKKIKEEELEEIKRLKVLVQDYKKSLESEEPGEDLIEKERSRHIYKRHNIKEKWIPLDTHADWNKYKEEK